MDREVARISAGQHGVVAHAQLLEAGLTPAGVKRRVAKGLLHPEFRAVYSVGHRALSVEARYMAAVLACGEGAVLSGLAAAHLYGLVKSGPAGVEISTTGHRHARGILIRRVRTLPRGEISSYREIPVTTVPRTIVDIAGRLSFDDLAWGCHQAGVRFRVSARPVLAVLRRRPHVLGAANVREIYEGEGITLSKLERAFRKLLRSDGLQLPLTNKVVDGRYVDCRWADYRLTVELDSYTFHHSRHAWEQDRRRERQARARGDEFRRYTYGDVSEDGDLVLAELRPLLGRP